MLFSESISDKKLQIVELLKQLVDAGKIKKGDFVMVDKGLSIKEEKSTLDLSFIFLCLHLAMVRYQYRKYFSPKRLPHIECM